MKTALFWPAVLSLFLGMTANSQNSQGTIFHFHTTCCGRIYLYLSVTSFLTARVLNKLLHKFCYPGNNFMHQT